MFNGQQPARPAQGDSGMSDSNREIGDEWRGEGARMGFDEADGSAPARQANGRFGPGNPGRRLGSRNKLTQRLVTSILADFERNRETVLSHLRAEHAAAYARLVARFLPPGAFGDLDEATPGAPALAGLGREALTEALARLGDARQGVDWPALSRAEDFLVRETVRARLKGEVAEALAATDRNNGESTVADADSALNEPGAPGAER
jgi:hypothetical protein